MEKAQVKKHCCGIILCAAAKSGMRVTAEACWSVGEGGSEKGGGQYRKMAENTGVL